MVLESTIQKHCSNRLRSHGWFVTKLIRTTTNGIPDCLCIKNGRTVFIEFKTPGQRPSELQLYMHDKLREQGVEVYIADCLLDIKPLL